MLEHQEDCPLFKLAPELRNEIYDLAFSSDTEPTRPVDLLQARSPSAALLLSCREIYEEAKGLYAHAIEDYWGKQHFEIDIDALVENGGASLPKHITDDVLKHVRHLALIGTRTSFEGLSISALEPLSPFWACTGVRAPSALERRGDGKWQIGKLADVRPWSFQAALNVGPPGNQHTVYFTVSGPLKEPDVFQPVTRAEVERLLELRRL